MQKFEQDIDAGKDVTLSDYLSYNNKDYSTKISKLGNKIAGATEYVMKEGIKSTVSIIKKLFS